MTARDKGTPTSHIVLVRLVVAVLASRAGTATRAVPAWRLVVIESALWEWLLLVDFRFNTASLLAS